MNIKQFLKNKEIILIILLGFILRFYKIKERFFWGLEASAATWPIIRLFEERKLTLIGQHLLTIKSMLFRPPFYIYIFALPLKIFNFDPFILAIIFALIGLLVILLFYLTTTKISGKIPALIVSYLYAISFHLVKNDKTVWTITPIIITSLLILFFLSKIAAKPKKQSLFFFLLGSVVGLGFSFHFQVVITLIILTFLFLKTERSKNIFFFLFGVVLLLSPLIIFNLRHDFLMLRGFKQLLSGREITIPQNKTFSGRLNNSLQTFSDLSLPILTFSSLKYDLPINISLFIFLFLLPLFFFKKNARSNLEKLMANYFFSCFLISLISLIIINQGFYGSNDFYIFFLIPPLLIIWAKCLFLLQQKLKYLLVVILFFISIANFYSIINQGPSSYQKKIAIIDYILKNAHGKKFSLKFINKDALSYDSLFYYRAPFYNLDFFKDINLIEQWHEGKPDFFLIHGEYDWEEDRYHIKPYKKIVGFQGIKIVIK